MSSLSEQACGNAEHLTTTKRHTQTHKQTQTHTSTDTHTHTQPVLKCPRSATATYLARRGAQTAARHPHRRTTVALNTSSAASRHLLRHLLRHDTCPGIMGVDAILIVSVLLGLDLTCNLHIYVTHLFDVLEHLTTRVTSACSA